MRGRQTTPFKHGNALPVRGLFTDGRQCDYYAPGSKFVPVGSISGFHQQENLYD